MGGQFENQRRAESRLLVILGVLMIVMLILLTVGTGSVRQAGLILGVVPLGNAGRLDLAAPDGPEPQRRERCGFHRTVRRGGAERHHHGVEPQSHAKVRPGAARSDHEGRDRALTAGTDDRYGGNPGMLPAAIHTGVGSDVQRGIATVVVGGLAIATVLTLFVLPSMYHVIEHWAEERRGRARWGA